MIPDYYAALEVPPTATTAEIKRSYRRLVRKYHPDLTGEAPDQHIKLLNEAYAILRDPAKRAGYDTGRAEEQRRLAVRQELRRKQQQARREQTRREQAQAKKEPEMTWAQGMMGFVRELKKALRED